MDVPDQPSSYEVSLFGTEDRMLTPGASTWGFMFAKPSTGLTVSGLSVGPQLEWVAY